MVMAIMVIVISFAAFSIKGIGGAASLSGEGDRVAGLVNFARQNAMSRGSLTALILVTDPASEGCLRAVSLWQAVQRPDGSSLTSNDWKQITGWETLRPGIVFMPPNDTEMEMEVPSTANISVLPTVRYRGVTLQPPNGYRIKFFLPSGGLMSEFPGVLSLAEGTIPPGESTPIYTHRNGANTPANTYTITIIAATGYTVIGRPD